MSKYILSINIHADDRELLENLMVTLESIGQDIGRLKQIELVTHDGCESIRFHTRTQQDETGPTDLERNLFLDKWMFC